MIRLYNIVFVSVIITLNVAGNEKVEMKIVNQLSSYGFNAFAGAESLQLTAKAKPLNYSGPPQLKKLLGKCFNFTQNEYRFSVCPFANVTQHEMSYRWNPYNGILGIYSGWVIDYNTFKHVKYEHGDDCGSKERSVKIEFVCGRRNNITNVTEPTTCNYFIKFETPLVCHEHAMLVYPRLSETNKKSWNQLVQDLHDGFITEKGFNISLSKLYYDAGLISKVPFKLSRPSIKPPEFASLNQCNIEYAKLYEELNNLKNEKK